jgi:adenylate cyclase
MQLGKTTLPPFTANDGPYTSADAAGYQLILDFKGGESPFQTISLTELLERNFPPGIFTNKIVLFGVAAESVKDNFFTPFSSGKGPGLGVPGIVIHAHLANQILRAALDGDKPIGSLNQYAQYGWILLWCIAGTIISLYAHSISRFIVIVSGGLLLLGSTAFIAFTSGLWVPFVAPALGWFASSALITAYQTGQERDKRKLLTQLFSAHVSDKVADEIWNKRSHFIEGNRLIPQEITATVLFTDIEKFTAISEALAPDELMDWLNLYMEAMANVVMEHGGVIDDYYGDAIKANFGVPVGHSRIDRIRENALDAIRCAMHMNTELENVNKLCNEKDMPELRMRIGVCTGNVVAGCIGSSKRMKYTTVGDTVNIAARLESFDKTQFSEADDFTNCRILISESTWKLVNNVFTAKAVGKLPLKGRRETIGVYHVTGKAQEVSHDV